MALKVKNSSKRNVAIAFTSIGLGLCSGLSHASIPAQGGIAAQLAQALGSRKMVVVHSNQVPGSGNSVTVTGTTTTAPVLNTAAFSLGVKPFKGAISMDQNTAQLLTFQKTIPVLDKNTGLLRNAQNAAGLLSLCAKLADPTGTGAIDDRCMLSQYHQSSGVLWPEQSAKIQTNWDPTSLTVPDAFMGSDRQLAMTDHLASYSALTTDDLQKNYDVTVSSDYYKQWNKVNYELAKNLGVATPGFTSIWNDDDSERSVKFDNGAVVTFKAGPAI